MKKSITIQLESSTLDILLNKSKELGMSVSSYIRAIILHHLENNRDGIFNMGRTFKDK